MNKERGERDARAIMGMIYGMVERYDEAIRVGDDDTVLDVGEEMTEVALSAVVRSDWVEAATTVLQPVEFRLLLATGGPAVQIEGTLDGYCQVESAAIQWQDWFTGWKSLDITEREKDALIVFCNQYYFGD